MCTPVIANGFPKSGTNLLAAVLDLLDYHQVNGAVASSLLHGKWSMARRFVCGSSDPRDSVLVGVDFPVCVRASRLMKKLKRLQDMEYISAHSRFSSHLHFLFRLSGAKVIQMIRDPRDIVVSHAFYCADTPSHLLYPFYRPMDFVDRLNFSISGGKTPQGYYLEDIGQRVQGMHGWLEQEDVLTVRFESLVGALGGAISRFNKLRFQGLPVFWGVQITDVQVANIQEKVFGAPGRTFRRGKIGSWKEYFKDQHIQMYNALAAEPTEKWGYQI